MHWRCWTRSGPSAAAVFGVCGGGIPLCLVGAGTDRVCPTSSSSTGTRTSDPERRISRGSGTSTSGSTATTRRRARAADVVDDVAYLAPEPDRRPQLSSVVEAGRPAWREPQDGGSARSGRSSTSTCVTCCPRSRSPPWSCSRPDAGARRAQHEARCWRTGSRAHASSSCPGRDYFPFAGDADAVADEVEEFLTGARAPRPVQRVLTTIFFSDIVGSTCRPPDSAIRSGGRASTSTMLRCVDSSNGSEGMR